MLDQMSRNISYSYHLSSFFLVNLYGKVKLIILNDNIFNTRNKMHSIYDSMN